MTSQYKDKKFTVQGADPPVPVGVGGDGTGHPRPSANDGPDPQVVNQAGAIKRVTGDQGNSADGSGEKKDRRVSEVRRMSTTSNIGTIDIKQVDVSPGKSLKHSRLNLISQLRRCNSFDTGKKRKVMDTSLDIGASGEDVVRRSEDPIAFVIREAIESIISYSQDLDKRITENSNTKREIKDIATKIRKSVDALRRDTSKSWLDKHKWTQVPVPTYDVESQTDFPVNNSDGTQDGGQLGSVERDSIAKHIRSKLGKNLSQEELLSVLDTRWPEAVYTKSKLEVTDNVEYRKRGNNILICKEEDEHDHILIKRFLKANSFIETTLSKEETPNSLLGQCTVSELFGTQEPASMREKTFSFLIRLKGNHSADDDMRLSEALKTIYEATACTQASDIACFTTHDYWKTRIRKHLEHAFTNYVSSVVLRVERKGSNPQRKDRKLPARNSSLIVKAGERSYSDLLREVRSKVQVDKIGVGIKKTRKTASGDLLITVKGSADKLKTLNKEVQEKVGGVTTVLKDTKDIFIYDVDEVATEEEIRTAFKQTLQATDEDLESASCRFLPINKFGGRTVVLNVNEKIAREACGLGKVKIGWTSSRVKMKVSVTRCYRCLQVGHTAGHCNGQDRSNDCLRCGQEGHKAKECQTTPRCLDCLSERHRVNSPACPRLSAAAVERSAGGGTRRQIDQQ